MSKLNFAKEALATRLSEKDQFQKYTSDDIIEPATIQPVRRIMGNDMWSVYNVIQEKIIHGMFDVYRCKWYKFVKLVR